jgi:hypothetical protein
VAATGVPIRETLVSYTLHMVAMNDWVKAGEAARILKIHRTRVYKLRDQGKLDVTETPWVQLFSRKQVEALAVSRRTQ